MESMHNEILTKARKDIKDALNKGIPMGPSHNNYSEQVVTWTLRIVAEKISIAEANSLIDEFNLTRFGWSHMAEN